MTDSVSFEDFARAVQRMRRLQTEYFAKRDSHYKRDLLIQCKEAEKTVDRQVAALFPDESVQGSLL